MVELMLTTPVSALDIPVQHEFVAVEIPALLGLDVLDGNNLPYDIMTNNLWNRIITSKDSLRFEDR